MSIWIQDGKLCGDGNYSSVSHYREGNTTVITYRIVVTTPPEEVNTHD